MKDLTVCGGDERIGALTQKVEEGDHIKVNTELKCFVWSILPRHVSPRRTNLLDKYLKSNLHNDTEDHNLHPRCKFSFQNVPRRSVIITLVVSLESPCGNMLCFCQFIAMVSPFTSQDCF